MTSSVSARLVRSLSVSLLAAFAHLGLASATTPDRVVLPADVVPTHYDLAIATDATAATFTGKVTIDIDVLEATSKVVLNAAALDLKTVTLSGVTGAPTVSFDKTDETVTLGFAAPVSPGHHQLAISYSGTITSNPAGLFYLDYDSAGAKKRALFTDFENADARRFLPCWDEPGRKATFTLTATVPAADLSVSNMPVAQTKNVGQGLKRVTFGTTPKMSSYLLFFATGDLERVSRRVGDVDVGVVVKRGDRAQAQFALDAASQILPFYNDYFGIRYPLPKLDLIAGPGQATSFEAMENWGAIFGFDSVLLVDPHLASQSERVHVYIDIAHEMAHQWFGDLVTMEWWDDLWLNEGFAEWMQFKATDHFHPDWKAGLDRLAEREGAMKIDSRSGTHPVIQPIRNVLQADQAFDEITYSKGMAVIRMLEDYAGEDKFRDAVRAYMKAHAYANAVTDDLWAELEKTAGPRVSTVAREFTRQEGVPLIDVSRNAQSVVLSQDRFYSDGTARAATVWDVPVVEQAAGLGPLWRGIVRRDTPVTINSPAGSLPVVNAGQAGYFRTRYSPDLFAALAARFGDLAVADQLGTVDDTRALALAGYEPASNILVLAGHVTPSTDPSVATVVSSQLRSLGILYRDLPGRPAFAAYVRGLLDPLLTKLGWTETQADTPNTRVLRGELIETLGLLDDPAVVSEAQALFAAYLETPQTLTGEVRNAVLKVVAMHADAATWDQLHTLARHASDATESQRYFGLLGTARDPVLAQRALDLVLSEEIGVTYRLTVYFSVADLHPDLAFDFAVAHAPAVNMAVEPNNRADFMATLLAHADSAESADKLRAYATAHIAPADQGPVRARLAGIADNVKVRTEDLPALDRWLQTSR